MHSRYSRYHPIFWTAGLLLVWILYSLPYGLAAWHFGGWAFETTLYRDPDRLLNFGMARTALDYGINFLDPVNRTDQVFYQFPLYWTLGLLSRITGMEPWAIANFLQLFTPGLLFVVFYRLGNRIIGNPLWALLASIAIFLYHPIYYGNHAYGEHAILVPFYILAFNSFSDTYAIFFGSCALLFFLLWHDQPAGSSKRLRYAAFFCLFYLLASLSQFLSFLYFSACIFLAMFFYYYRPVYSPRKIWIASLLALTGAILLILTAPHLLPLPLLVFIAIIIYGVTVFHAWPSKAVFVPLIPVAIVALYVINNLAAISASGSSAFAYQNNVRTLDLAIPLTAAVISYLPFLLPAPMALAKIRHPYAYFLHGIFWASIFSSFNHAFGYNNHPYRFLYHAFPYLVMIGFLGLRLLLQQIQQCQYSSKMLYPATACLTPTALLFLYSSLEYKSEFGQLLQNHFQPVSPEIRMIAEFCEDERESNPDVRIAFRDKPFTALDLAPYTGARFYDYSILSFNEEWYPPWEIRPDYEPFHSINQILERIETESLPIDILIVDQQALFLRDNEPPPDKEWTPLGHFRVYRFHGP